MKRKESKWDRMESGELHLPNISMVDLYFEKWQDVKTMNENMEDKSPVMGMSNTNLSLSRDKYFDKIGSIMEKLQDLSSGDSSSDSEDLSCQSSNQKVEERSEDTDIIELQSIESKSNSNSNSNSISSHSSLSPRKSGWRRRGWFTGFPPLPSPAPRAPPSSPSPYSKWLGYVEGFRSVDKAEERWGPTRTAPTPPAPPPLEIIPAVTPVRPARCLLPPRRTAPHASWPPAPPPPHLPPPRSTQQRSLPLLTSSQSRSLTQQTPAPPARSPLPKRKPSRSPSSRSPPSQSLSSRTPLSQSSSPPLPPALRPPPPLPSLTRSLSLTTRPTQLSSQSLFLPYQRIPGLLNASKTTPKLPQVLRSSEANLRSRAKKAKLSIEVKDERHVRHRVLSNRRLHRSHGSASDTKQNEKRADELKKSIPETKMRNRFSVKVPRKESPSPANENQSDQKEKLEEKEESKPPSLVAQKLCTAMHAARSTLEIREAMDSRHRLRIGFQQKPATGQNISPSPCLFAFKAATAPVPLSSSFMGRRIPGDGERKRHRPADLPKVIASTTFSKPKSKSPDLMEVKKFIMNTSRHESPKNFIDKSSHNKKQSNLAPSRKNKTTGVGCVRSTRNCWDHRTSPRKFYTEDGIWQNLPGRPLLQHF